jgi:hypothetical protein
MLPLPGRGVNGDFMAGIFAFWRRPIVAEVLLVQEWKESVTWSLV